MESKRTLKPTHFSVFASAAEELEMSVAMQRWDNEGGRVRMRAARLRHCSDSETPRIVVLTDREGDFVERSFVTMRDADVFLRTQSPASTPRLATLYDQPPQVEANLSQKGFSIMEQAIKFNWRIMLPFVLTAVVIGSALGFAFA